MRGEPQVGGARLPAALPGRRWLSWSLPTRRRPRLTPAERLETTARLQAEGRAARRSGRYGAERPYLPRGL